MEHSNPKKKISIIDLIYEESHPRESDLISEAGGNEFFLIEGDSLLLDILKAPYRRIDWNCSGQFLHLLAAIEQFLHQILLAGGKFAIIFFDCNRSLWEPSMQCFRYLLIQHLTYKTEIDVHCLPTWIPRLNDKFVREFMQTLPAFVALSDAEYATNPAMVRQFRAFFAFCKQSLNTCFISSVRPRSGRLIGLICGPLNRIFKFSWSSIALKQEDAPTRSEWPDATNDLSWLESITSLSCIGAINALSDEEKPQALELCKAMLLHASLISHLPLQLRSLNVKIDQGNELIQGFLDSYFSTLNVILESYNFGQASSVDIFDGRLFSSLLVFFANNENLKPSDILTDAEYTKLERIWNQIAGPGTSFIPRIDFVKGVCAPTFPLVDNHRMITCDSVVKSIVITEPIGVEGDVFQPPRDVVEFTEDHHWHSNKPLQDTLWSLSKNEDPVQSNDKRAQRRENKNAQKYYRFITKYASSLEGNKLYQAAPLILGSKINEQQDKPKKSYAKKGAPKQGQSKKLAIIQQNSNNKDKKKRDEWLQTKASITNLWQGGRREDAVLRLQNELRTSCPSDVNLEIRLLLLKIHLKYLEGLRQENKEEDWTVQNHKVEIFKIVHKIIDKHGAENDKNAQLTESIKSDLVKALATLKFYDSALLVAKELNVKPPKVGKDGESSIKFQLQVMGHLLKRKNSVGFDARVGFNPDAWQKELLDIVDANGSALVVAPTSAGKTFISYYAMKRVLEATEDGTVVYISPTKALVNQVTAEIYARFRNCQEQLKNGTSIFGAFTRDYRHKPLNCRILVCVPQCFEILLMSPLHSEWAKKIKYVIFDEVHSIAEVGSGEVWEHLFSLISCPFLALSATVQDTAKLRNWLQVKLDQQNLDVKIQGTSVEFQPREAKQRKVHLIEYKHRYSDLTRFVYSPKNNLTRIHPCSLLYATVIRQKGFPKEIMLEPCDLVHLYDAMAKGIDELSDSAKSMIQSLNYQSNDEFKTSRQISKLQVIAWQENLTQAIVTIAEGHAEWLDKVFLSLGKIQAKSNVINDIFALLMHLKKQNQLPVIVFSFDRNLCEELARITASKLRSEESKTRKPESNEPKTVSVPNPRLKRLDPDTIRQTEPDMDFSRLKAAEHSFVDPGALTNIEIDEDLLTPQERYLISLGIGIHHAGRRHKYKQTVEFLFRSKAIQVVFATTTLALGVNMPCKTVVFAKDSMYLNSLSYRQMSGRAGRRGYEKRGNVIFMEVNQGKIRRLFNGELPILETNFPLSVTLVLRAFLLYKDEPTSASALKIKKLFSEPLSDSSNNHKLQSYFRFAMEYLMKECLLMPDGKTIGLAGMAAHLWWAEPANLLLVSLVQRSVLHDICRDATLTDEQKKKQLLVVLSTIFNPYEIHPSMMKHIKENKTASKIVLESPPQSVIDAIAAHNRNIIETFLNTRRSIQNNLVYDPVLPLSKIKHVIQTETPTNALYQHLQSTRVVTQLRDPFSVLSGASDEFGSVKVSQGLMRGSGPNVVKEICACIPDIDQGMLPVFKYSPDMLLNRYVLDYYEHEQLDLLEEANWLNAGDSYELTNTFRLILKAISSILREITDETDLLRKYIEELALEYGTRLRPELRKRAFFK